MNRFDRTCIIEGCDNRGYCRGWCCSHYERWRVYGDPLGGCDVTPAGEARRYFEEVVRTYNGNECLFWPYSRNKSGYGTLRDGKVRRVHRLICEQENGPAPTPKHEAAHSCGKGSLGCVAKRHLSWKTRGGNAADKVLHGTTMRGELHLQAKLTREKVIEIRRLKGMKTHRELAAMFGVTTGYISSIQTGRKWAWLAEADPVRRQA